MVVPNQDGVSDCREINIEGTVSSRSPGRKTEVVLVDGSVRDSGLPITAPLDVFVESHINILTDLKTRLETAEKVAAPLLRQYVTDKSFPIDERFDVWKKWCKKKVHGWSICGTEVPLFGQLVEDCTFDFDRYVDYDWKYFFERFEDTYWKLQEKYDVTMDDVKEALIETNFGSFTHDW